MQLVEQQAYIKASNTGGSDFFGNGHLALSADGNTLVVAAYAEDSAATGVNGDQADNSAPDSGAVYIFVRAGSTWQQQAYLKASNTGAGDFFGMRMAVSADGDTLAVGAPYEDSNAVGINGDQSSETAPDSGAVYVFIRNGSSWAQQAYLKGSNTGSGDVFFQVTLSDDGNTLAVGAGGEDSAATGVDGNQADESSGNAGAVYVFTRASQSWSQQAYVKASNTEPCGTPTCGDGFAAASLSGDGNTVSVGALAESSAATGVGGDQRDNSAPRSGAVYVFARSGDAWSQTAYIKASNTSMYDQFGGWPPALSTDGTTLAIPAGLEASAAVGIGGDQLDNSARFSGAIYVFARSSSTWAQQAYIKQSNTGAEDNFGFNAVTLSGDGAKLAIGAYGEDSGAKGLNGDQSDNSAESAGAAYLFTRASGSWSQLAYLKASNTDAGDGFGFGVGLSRDGGTLAVGAATESSAASGINGDQSNNAVGGSGAVYVFAVP